MYREALVVMLHESKTIACATHNMDVAPAWMGNYLWGEQAQYTIRFDEIAALLNMAGMDAGGTVETPLLQKEKGNKHGVARARDLSLGLYDSYSTHETLSVEGRDITVVECDVLSANLLNIRTTLEDVSGNTYIEEMTYSGAFSIWWQPRE